jgi:tRNA(adenine34) deaminase
MNYLTNLQEAEWFMGLALEEAHKASSIDEVPIGAVLVSSNGEVLARSHNLKEKTHNPLGHAELLVIQEASKKIADWRLTGATLYVTLEPCLMCIGALWQSRIETIVFGAYDSKGGFLSLNYNVHQDKRLNHQMNIMGGVRHVECGKILSEFFRLKRKDYQHDHKS